MKLNIRFDPYRRFTLILAMTLLLFAAVMMTVSFKYISDFIHNDTVQLTRSAVDIHFKLMFTDLFQEQDILMNESREYYSTDQTSYGTEDETSKDLYTPTYKLIRMHFDLYSITDTQVYASDGTTIFSYEQDKIGKAVDPVKSRDFQLVEKGGSVANKLDGHLLNLWLPILDQSGQQVGVVEITRDFSVQNNQMRQFQSIMFLVILGGLIVMFFALRNIYIRSTRTIDEKNQELHKMVETIENTYNESLQALSSALDSRDHETNGHSFRVTAYSIRLGSEMGLSDQELVHLARGALLHDVGKIGVPDAILLKPDKLTDKEWKMMKNHVHIGYDMLSHIEFLQPALDVVRYHHERWDGKGYPFEIQNEKIPIFAAIFSVCDAFDAITSDRPYRQGISIVKAKQEIYSCMGTQFRPDVVKAFLNIPDSDWEEYQSVSDHRKDFLNQLIRYQ